MVVLRVVDENGALFHIISNSVQRASSSYPEIATAIEKDATDPLLATVSNGNSPGNLGGAPFRIISNHCIKRADPESAGTVLANLICELRQNMRGSLCRRIESPQADSNGPDPKISLSVCKETVDPTANAKRLPKHVSMQERLGGYSVHTSPVGSDPEESGFVNVERVDCRVRETGGIGSVMGKPSKYPGSLIISEQTPTPGRNPHGPSAVFTDVVAHQMIPALCFLIREGEMYERSRVLVKLIHIAVCSYPDGA
jgi:hypothetical protein